MRAVGLWLHFDRLRSVLFQQMGRELNIHLEQSVLLSHGGIRMSMVFTFFVLEGLLD